MSCLEFYWYFERLWRCEIIFFNTIITFQVMGVDVDDYFAEKEMAAKLERDREEARGRKSKFDPSKLETIIEDDPDEGKAGRNLKNFFEHMQKGKAYGQFPQEEYRFGFEKGYGYLDESEGMASTIMLSEEEAIWKEARDHAISRSRKRPQTDSMHMGGKIDRGELKKWFLKQKHKQQRTDYDAEAHPLRTPGGPHLHRGGHHPDAPLDPKLDGGLHPGHGIPRKVPWTAGGDGREQQRHMRSTRSPRGGSPRGGGGGQYSPHNYSNNNIVASPTAQMDVDHATAMSPAERANPIATSGFQSGGIHPDVSPSAGRERERPYTVADFPESASALAQESRRSVEQDANRHVLGHSRSGTQQREQKKSSKSRTKGDLLGRSGSQRVPPTHPGATQAQSSPRAGATRASPKGNGGGLGDMRENTIEVVISPSGIPENYVSPRWPGHKGLSPKAVPGGAIFMQEMEEDKIGKITEYGKGDDGEDRWRDEQGRKRVSALKAVQDIALGQKKIDPKKGEKARDPRDAGQAVSTIGQYRLFRREAVEYDNKAKKKASKRQQKDDVKLQQEWEELRRQAIIEEGGDPDALDATLQDDISIEGSDSLDGNLDATDAEKYARLVSTVSLSETQRAKYAHLVGASPSALSESDVKEKTDNSMSRKLSKGNAERLSSLASKDVSLRLSQGSSPFPGSPDRRSQVSSSRLSQSSSRTGMSKEKASHLSLSIDTDNLDEKFEAIVNDDALLKDSPRKPSNTVPPIGHHSPRGPPPESVGRPMSPHSPRRDSQGSTFSAMRAGLAAMQAAEQDKRDAGGHQPSVVHELPTDRKGGVIDPTTGKRQQKVKELSRDVRLDLSAVDRRAVWEPHSKTWIEVLNIIHKLNIDFSSSSTQG